MYRLLFEICLRVPETPLILLSILYWLAVDRSLHNFIFSNRTFYTYWVMNKTSLIQLLPLVLLNTHSIKDANKYLPNLKEIKQTEILIKTYEESTSFQALMDEHLLFKLILLVCYITFDISYFMLFVLLLASLQTFFFVL